MVILASNDNNDNTKHNPLNAGPVYICGPNFIVTLQAECWLKS